MLSKNKGITMTEKRIYLAGPDVFFENPTEHFKKLQHLCAVRGLVGVVPSDGGLSQGVAGTGDEIAERIYQANMELIRSSVAILANVSPFRGKMEPDSGTVFEVGAGVILGKLVAGYAPAMRVAYEEKVRLHFGQEERAGLPFDKEYGYLIESLGQPMNLMLSRSTALFDDVELALDYLAEKLK